MADFVRKDVTGMKIGFCAKLERINEVAAGGYDYIELPVSAAAAWTEDEFARNLELLRAASIPAPAFNVLFPGDIALLNPDTGFICCHPVRADAEGHYSHEEIRRILSSAAAIRRDAFLSFASQRMEIREPEIRALGEVFGTDRRILGIEIGSEAASPEEIKHILPVFREAGRGLRFLDGKTRLGLFQWFLR